ncbi:hypothetical protein DXG03_006914 [Asterophora parasitica]|uniref:Uncharacterized protein n=1 Tax=Asterophora parasitica TaxID=117018 RepID=A0A9P7GD35_9AGAR|nr:hypothetical protein DXG03_006914 [Asterophora parasitica]
MLGIPYVAPLLHTPDGVDLSCYLLPQTYESLADGYRVPGHPIEDNRVDVTPAAAEARATVIVFHGNSAHHWEDMTTAGQLFAMRCNVLLLSYRGYSLSGGSPNEKGLRIDAQTGLDYILDHPYLSNVPIVSGIIASNTFTSIPDIVRRWPYIGIFSFICHQKWRSADKMQLIPTTTPILMLSGRRDQVIPPELMDKLWDAAQKRGKKRKSVFPGSCVSSNETSDLEPTGDIFVPIRSGTHSKLSEAHLGKCPANFVQTIPPTFHNTGSQ